MSAVAITASNTFVEDPGSNLRARIESSLDERLSSTLMFHERAAPLTVTTGIASLDALTEITGPASSGRTGVMLAALAGATRRQEVCALVDASDSFDPASAAAAGVALNRLLWVRCNNVLKRNGAGVKSRSSTNHGFAFAGVLEQVLKVADLLLQGGGFGMVVLDLGDIPVESARRVPLTSWFRFRRAVEPTATVLLLIEQEPCAKTCASLVLRLQPEAIFASSSSTSSTMPAQHGLEFSSPTTRSDESGRHVQAAHSTASSWAEFFHEEHAGEPGKFAGGCLLSIPKNNIVGHAALFRGMRFRAEVVRFSVLRKPPRSAGTNFELCTAL